MGFPRRLAAALAALSLAAVGCGAAVVGGTTAGSVRAVNAARTPLLPARADALPSFDPARFEALLGELRGTPVVVNVWGSWCTPCRSEAPLLARAHAEHGREVQFLGVDILDSRTSARRFIDEFGWRFPSVFDPSGAIRDALGLLGQPGTVFYDRGGEPVLTWQGPLDARTLERGLRMILR
ncbi:MAG TPA: TlpA disulfide reductase family protein [Actinomycetota bacterium]|nr:TlpA disulfide reductase family protein [Actinomycetota bacterium]